MNESTPKQNGIGFLGILSLIFITLKLTGYIDWSWWLILSPLLFVPVMLLSLVLIATIIHAFKKILGR